MSDQVGNPEDRFSHNEAHFESLQKLTARPQQFNTDRSNAVLLLWFSLLLVFMSVSVLSSPSLIINPLVTNGLSHPYHLDESTLNFRDIRRIFFFQFSMNFL